MSNFLSALGIEELDEQLDVLAKYRLNRDGLELANSPVYQGVAKSLGIEKVRTYADLYRIEEKLRSGDAFGGGQSNSQPAPFSQSGFDGNYRFVSPDGGTINIDNIKGALQQGLTPGAIQQELEFAVKNGKRIDGNVFEWVSGLEANGTEGEEDYIKNAINLQGLAGVIRGVEQQQKKLTLEEQTTGLLKDNAQRVNDTLRQFPDDKAQMLSKGQEILNYLGTIGQQERLADTGQFAQNQANIDSALQVGQQSLQQGMGQIPGVMGLAAGLGLGSAANQAAMNQTMQQNLMGGLGAASQFMTGMGDLQQQQGMDYTNSISQGLGATLANMFGLNQAMLSQPSLGNFNFQQPQLNGIQNGMTPNYSVQMPQFMEMPNPGQMPTYNPVGMSSMGELPGAAAVSGGGVGAVQGQYLQPGAALPNAGLAQQGQGMAESRATEAQNMAQSGVGPAAQTAVSPVIGDARQAAQPTANLLSETDRVSRATGASSGIDLLNQLTLNRNRLYDDLDRNLASLEVM